MFYVNKDNIDCQTKQWMQNIAPFNNYNFKIKPEATALLVIDMQNFFLDPNCKTFTCGGLAIIDKIKGSR